MCVYFFLIFLYYGTPLEGEFIEYWLHAHGLLLLGKIITNAQ